MKPTKRLYHATFILDNRGSEDSIEKIIEEVKGEIAAVQGEVSTVTNLGKHDFARVTDAKFTGANYVQIDFTSDLECPARLRERLRLNHRVYRTFIQSK